MTPGLDVRICFLSAEYSPFAKTGGLGDVAAALTRQLSRRGHDVRTFIPLHGQMDLRGVDLHPVEFLQNLTVRVGAHEFHFGVQTARVPGAELWVYLVDCRALFDRPRIYSDAADEHVRYLMLTRAAFECCQRMGFAPEILHANDWHTAFAPLLLRTAYAWDTGLFGATKSVFTIHNIGYQGVFSAGHAGDLGPGVGIETLHQADLAAGRVNPMRHGVIYADAVTTVSPTYADEIRTVEGGHGLDADLRARGAAVSGVLNGVDYDEWNPATDRYIPHRYDANDLTGKARNKEALLDLLRMPATATTPLIGMVTRLTRQKGVDLLYDTLPEVLERGEARLVALGAGEQPYERFMHSLQERYPGRAVFYSGYSEELAHFIEAASDIFLMPSMYEPCGLNQMYSLKYGTVPIVRRTGGLADSVRHFDPASGQGTGVLFNDFDAGGVRWALATALEWFGWPSVWRRLVLNGMREDFSWEKQVLAYEELYRGILGDRA
jgi:starch synthase